MSGDQVGLALAEQRRRQIPLGLLAMHSGLLTSAEVHRVLRAQTHRRAWKRFGEVATEMGLLDSPASETLLDRQRRTRPRLGAILVEQGAVEPDELSTLVERHHGIALGSQVSPPSWNRAV